MRNFLASFLILSALLVGGCSATQRGAIEDARSASCRVIRRGCQALVGACDATEPAQP